MKKLALVVVFGSLLVGLIAAPAAADKPAEFVDNVSFPDVNVCTGEEHTVNITFNVRVHEHRNNSVVTVKSNVETSDGWAGGGIETVAENENVVSVSLNTIVEDPETGQKYKVKSRFLFDISDEEAQLDNFDIRCISS